MRKFTPILFGLAAALGAACGSNGEDIHPVCGDDAINQDSEECDKTRLGGKTCADLGFESGTLACADDCTFDTSGCEPQETRCPNGVVDPGEECDGEDLADTTCEDLGYQGGVLACNQDCTFDRSACLADPCGDGVVGPGEECDGDDLDDWSCEDFGFGGGALACSQDCRLDASGCTGCQDDALEENDRLEQSARIDPGSYRLSMCSTGDEEDWFSLELLDGDTVVVELVQAEAWADLDLELSDADGLVLASSADLGLEERLVHQVEAGGTYHLRVFVYAGGFAAVEYTLTLTKNPECVSHPDCPPGEICRDFACAPFVCSDANPCPQELICSAGSCFECVSAADCPEADAYACEDHVCVFRCQEDAYEPNSTRAEAAPIPVGFSQAGLTLCGSGDQDWFSVELESLRRYRLEVAFAHAQGDINVEVFEAAGDNIPVAVGYSDDDNESVTIGVGAAGTYLIRVWQPAGELAQTYRLTLEDRGAVDCAWDRDCPTPGDICRDFICVTPECREDGDCTAPRRCVAHVCVAPPPGDTCAEAVVVDAFPFTAADVDLAPYRNAVRFDPGACTEWGTAGNDAIYRVALASGQDLWATVSADFDAALAIIGECAAEPPAEACLAGADEVYAGQAETVYYRAFSDQTVFVVVDTFAPLFPPEGTYSLTIEVE